MKKYNNKIAYSNLLNNVKRIGKIIDEQFQKLIISSKYAGIFLKRFFLNKNKK